MDVLPKETITKITNSFYNKDVIVQARKLLMETIPNTMKRIPMHVSKTDIIDNFYDVLQKLSSEKPA